MTTAEKQLLCDSLDQLWGACDSLSDICCMLVDGQDRRITNASDALCKARDSIEGFRLLMLGEK